MQPVCPKRTKRHKHDFGPFPLEVAGANIFVYVFGVDISKAEGKHAHQGHQKISGYGLDNPAKKLSLRFLVDWLVLPRKKSFPASDYPKKGAWTRVDTSVCVY